MLKNCNLYVAFIPRPNQLKMKKSLITVIVVHVTFSYTKISPLVISYLLKSIVRKMNKKNIAKKLLIALAMIFEWASANMTN